MKVITTVWNRYPVVMPHLGCAINLFIRCWLAFIFMQAGWAQLLALKATLLSFQYEYHVPLIDYTTAAYLAIWIQLFLPPLMVMGLGGRWPTAILFMFNLIAVWSYPFLLTTNGSEGLEDHFYWGLLLAVLLCYGYGKWSLDYFIQWRKRNIDVVPIAE